MLVRSAVRDQQVVHRPHPGSEELMSKTSPSQGAGCWKPLIEFTPAQLYDWKSLMLMYKQYNKPGWHKEHRQPRPKLEERRLSRYMYRAAIVKHNKWVGKKQSVYRKREELGLPASPVRMQRLQTPELTFTCKFTHCTARAHRVIPGMNLCPEHSRLLKEVLNDQS